MYKKNSKGYYTLDYSYNTEERSEYVKYICDHTNPKNLTPHYLHILSDYILSGEKNRNILSANRMVTINRREVSMEQIIDAYSSESNGMSAVSGADKIYNILNIKPDPVQKLTQKYFISDTDIQNVPGLQQLHDEIEKLEQQLPKTSGRTRYHLKKTIIELRKDQYILKNSAKPTIFMHTAVTHNSPTEFSINEYEGIEVDYDGQIFTSTPYNFFNKNYMKILCENYALLQEWAEEHCGEDLYYSYKHFHHLVTDILRIRKPFFYDLLLMKNADLTTAQIQQKVQEKYQISYAVEYYSVLWQHHLPTLLVKYAEEEFINWYFTFKRKGSWKMCHRCGEVKLRMTRFFSRNKYSSDGFYSVCKECRSKKYRDIKGGILQCYSNPKKDYAVDVKK